MRLFFVLSSLFFMSACSSQVYTCHDETGFRGKDFEFDDEKATINSFKSFYYTKKNTKQLIQRETLYINGDWPQADTQRSMWLYEYHDPLKAKIGSYNAKKTDKEIVARYVLEHILSIAELPSGELVDTGQGEGWDKLFRSGKYSHWTSSWVQILMVEKYVFNISKKTLTVFHEYPFPPIRGEKIKWKFENRYHSQPKYLGPMSEEELADKRFYPKKTRIESYPDCNALNLLELFLYHTLPLWGWLAYLN